jgi:hypothetical protein
VGIIVRKRFTLIHLYLPVKLWKKRRRWNLLHIYATGSRAGVSWTFAVGAWSWNTRARQHRVDLPGPLSWAGKRHPR